MSEKPRKPIVRGSCGEDGPVIRNKKRKHLRRKRPVTTLGSEQEIQLDGKKWDPDSVTARKIFPD